MIGVDIHNFVVGGEGIVSKETSSFAWENGSRVGQEVCNSTEYRNYSLATESTRKILSNFPAVFSSLGAGIEGKDSSKVRNCRKHLRTRR